eukprot:5475315-Prymnesium_polylepis.1
MPRDKGGHGRTGSKHKKAIAKFHAKINEAAARPATSASLPASKTAPATTDTEVEDPGATPSKAQEEPEQHETENVTKKSRKRLRFAADLPRNDDRHSRPTHTGRTWGRHFDRPTEHFSHSNADDLKADRKNCELSCGGCA